jgi:deazaflavin-dependent oxidoreductase (nitroreductase family)
MTRPRYSLFHAAVQKIAATRAGAWLLARRLHHLDRLVFRLSGRRTTLTSWLSGIPVVMLTTIGAKSHLPRSLPLMAIGADPALVGPATDDSAPGPFALVASNFGQRHYPAWYYNLKANPLATCTLRGQTGEYIAHEATGAEYDRFWQCAQDAYAGFPLYKERASHRRIPIMVLTPANPHLPPLHKGG